MTSTRLPASALGASGVPTTSLHSSLAAPPLLPWVSPCLPLMPLLLRGLPARRCALLWSPIGKPATDLGTLYTARGWKRRLGYAPRYESGYAPRQIYSVGGFDAGGICCCIALD